ncbi:hypothetical protein BI364_05620 [Acidihalobacter yilgarnensis]|uniref:Lytic transglycosylase n=1 Tax=Acidihalobacter yilgarnensis TaxID=2819280 RepID=A0A1D8IM30_9GAMM|nr:LysM peptidoglycan-binding domain-containing protein [Acidihalobacter yilgarnensis]AOU97513.1 hypothetical protein BI364_05620 [Acidihalobacter yilgarnensis]
MPAAIADAPDTGAATANLASTDAGAPATPPPDSEAVDGTTPAVVSQQNETIWTGIRSGFQMPDSLNQPLVQNAIAFYRQHPAYLERVTARAEPYLYYILQQIHERHMPTELALLPVVESAYIPYAYSSCQAAGIWQFTPSTGRHFGLKQNWWYDGRRDIYASTKAALDYLQALHNQFGSWLLALAAYNSGAGTVQWAIRRNQERHLPTDFWALDLPEQTKTYVPKLLAVKAIVEHPKQYNVSLWPIPDKPYLAVVHLKSQIDLALAAKLAGIKLNELYLLNPGYNRWATDPNGPHRLLLPADSAQQFEEKLASIPASERVTWIRHRVASGETLGLIADEYHTSIAVVRQTNHLHGNLIRIGQYLIVPRSSKPYQAYAMAQGLRHRMAQPAHGGSNKHYHVVKPGDTLWDIAKAYNVSVTNLARWNNMTTHAPLRLGQHLVIWSHGSTIVRPAQTQLASNSPPSNPGAVYHTVKSGDTLWDIARNYKVSVSDLQHWNHLTSHSALRPGQRLVIRPGNGATGTAGLAIASNAQPAQRVRTVSYTVRNGDSLYSIAQRFGVNIPAIRRWNSLGNTDILHPGEPLKLRVDVTQMHNES